MEFNLDESSLSVLKNIFEWTDIDADGKVSREDLQNSLGLASPGDANQLFCSLKDLAGGDSKDDYLTFEEYCKGIMDFPLLLDKFKQEFQSKSGGTFSIVEREESFSSQRDSELGFLPAKLRDAIYLYNKVLKIDIPDLESPHAEDLLEALRMCLEGLKNKSKHETLPVSDILNGTIELYLLVRDLSRYHEEVINEMKDEVFEHKTQSETLSKKYDRVVENNEKLLNKIMKLEQSRENFSQVNEHIFEEKKKLEIKLEKAEKQENHFNDYVNQIENVILEKEKELARMEKQLRQLNSLKTLQEMRGTTGRPTEEMKVQRLAGIKYRQSVPVNNNSPEKHTRAGSSNSDIKVTIISNQLKRKNEEIQIKVNEIDELAYTSRKYYEEIMKLKEENQRLNEKCRMLQNEIGCKRTEDRESLLLPSLFDELQLLKEGSVTDYHKSILYQQFNEIKASHKSLIALADIGCQTDLIKTKGEKDRGCCSWF